MRTGRNICVRHYVIHLLKHDGKWTNITMLKKEGNVTRSSEWLGTDHQESHQDQHNLGGRR